MMTYRVRASELQHLAIDHGITPNPAAIAASIGVGEDTLRAVFRGGRPSNATMAALVAYFRVPTERLFDLVDDDTGRIVELSA